MVVDTLKLKEFIKVGSCVDAKHLIHKLWKFMSSEEALVSFYSFHTTVLYFSSDNVISLWSSSAAGREKVTGLGDV